MFSFPPFQMHRIKRSFRLCVQSAGRYWRAKSVGKPPFVLYWRNRLYEIQAPASRGSISVFVEVIGDDIYKSSLWLKCLSEKPIVLDVGSNFGIFSSWIKIKFPKALVTAIEPHPDVLPFLERNAAALGFNVMPNAVSQGGHPVLMDISNDSTTSYVLDSTDSANSLSGLTTVKVESVSWDHIFDNHSDKVDLLKCDCEGGELDLLSDINLLKRSRVIVMEYHFSHVKEAWVINQIQLAGFAVLSNIVGPYSGHLVAVQDG